MTQTELLEELKKPTISERLAVIQAALAFIRKDLQQIESAPNWAERKAQLASVAATLLPDYETDDELVAFTALDDEDFHAQE